MTGNKATLDPVTGLAITRPGRPPGLVITGGAVVTVDDELTIHDPGWIQVEGDRIVALGPGPAPGPVLASVLAAGGRVIDADGGVVMPGMVNGHTHLFQTFFRGLADDKPLLDWLRECIWPGAVHLDHRSMRLAALVGLVENLRGGATSVLDHQYIHVDPHQDRPDRSLDDAVCSAAADTGVRFLLARGWADRNYEPRLSEPVQLVLERTRAVHARWHGHDGGRIRLELAPLIPWGCSDEAMAATLAQARAWGVGTHIHCAETAIEVEMSLTERGLRHAGWLDSLGALGPDTQLAHGVWLDDAELDLIARRGAVVVHCPVSNMYLASGVPPLLGMVERGITVALASDGPGSNNRQDLFEVLKTAVLLQKVHHLDAVALQPTDVLTMACRGGAAAMGLRDDIGCLAPGRRADLLVVDLRSVFCAPVHRIPSALVFNASPAAVRHVVVDGRILIDEGHLTMLDEGALLGLAEDAARDLFARAGIASRLTRHRTVAG